MRYVAPARGAVDAAVFERLPLAGWNAYADLLHGPDWPSLDALNAHWPAGAHERFAAQTPMLLADGRHYEQRIAEAGAIATRDRNWHDLFNALVWLRHAPLKRALNAQQVAEIAQVGPKRRSRPQCALTHFDEAGVILLLRDPALLAPWDAHDWHGLFWRQRAAWLDGSLELAVFGHALLEHALTPGRLLVGKAIAVVGRSGIDAAYARVAEAIAAGHLLRDPQELRPLPLSGLPGWHEENEGEAFHRETECYRPLRAGRCYPAPLVM
ncbi:DUF3025 domain-containing protein [Frateuria hangzhouensis]|uniref:DUF3025 domain-containing protein n=1 Tax=Frateuria hangzhouensis TaxID=2995589 RepID=UPI002260CE12|nr:DUF3025 domain-containing protein [Frateuria sp. STR12]MCX7514842.1 DUF3025 domain-containing protein [Frateuria sp. STR12]